MPEHEAVMSPSRHPRRVRLGACGLAMAAAFLAACATGRGETRDESAERIENIIGTQGAAEPIPEGISLGPDAPPLSGAVDDEPLALLEVPAEPPPQALSLGDEEPLLQPLPSGAAVMPCTPPPHGAILPAPVPLGCLLKLGPIQYRLTPRPGGSIPGLLP